MEDIKETMDRIRKQAEEIKQKVIDTKKAKQFTNIEDKAIISMEFIEDMQFLINVIDILEKKSKQDMNTIKHLLNAQYGKEVTDNINKVQLSSLYGQYQQIYKNVKRVNIDTSSSYFKDENVDVKITDKFVIIRKKEENLRFFNINEIEYFSITQNESEV